MAVTSSTGASHTRKAGAAQVVVRSYTLMGEKSEVGSQAISPITRQALGACSALWGPNPGQPGCARMQFKKISCASTSGKGPPLAVSAISQRVTATPSASHKSLAPVPTRPSAPITMARGTGAVQAAKSACSPATSASRPP